MIVIHYTAIPTLQATLRTFKPVKIHSHRTYIKKFGELNVGVHFVVDKNGDIYSLLPEDVIGRHTIGFNHIAFGIENVAGDKTELTGEQMKSNARLVNYLVHKYPSIKYLIGHHEYMREKLPHFKLFKELDENYKPTKKGDPGEDFMMRLRVMLKKNYEIELEK
ncbi:MAG: N-acetylmuramoyl-L-alanine amidase [bacterium]|nr:MAG: N-acetylmuramoyl-L-alanine amidase [bacterium]